MKRPISVLLSLAVGVSVYGAGGFADYGGSYAYAEEYGSVISEQNIELEYTETVYNGKAQSPKVIVTVGETTLAEGVDYTVKYPTDRINAGEKKIKITAKGKYSGTAEAVYTVQMLDCSDSLVEIEAEDCYYNGLPQCPEVTVKCGGMEIPKSQYSLSLSDNVEVGEAKCVINFRGNCKGKSEFAFNILKAVRHNIEIDYAANRGESVSIDLSTLKPAGAIFASPYYRADDFSENGQPKVAFNILKFTLSQNSGNNVGIVIPMTNIPNCEDYNLEFYISVTDKTIPQIEVKPFTKVYDGKAVTLDEITENGCSVSVGGKEISGSWQIWENLPVMPCDKQPVMVEFIPDDESFSNAYALTFVSIERKEISDFKASANAVNLDWGDRLAIRIDGIPEDYDGSVSVKAEKEDEFYIVSDNTVSGRRTITLGFPNTPAYHTIKLSLDGSAFYKNCSAEFTVAYGSVTPIEPNTATTEKQLAELIEIAENSSIIKVNGMKSISAELLSLAAKKHLTIEARVTDSLCVVAETAKMNTSQALDLNVYSAVIPQVLIGNLGEEQLEAFTFSAKNTKGISIKADVKTALPIACLYLYSTSGELVHKGSAKISAGSVKIPISEAGKYVITGSSASHIEHDLNNDCKVDLDDVVRSLDLFLMLMGEPSEEQLEVLDFNRDKKVTIEDVVAFLDYCIINL